MYVIGLTGGVGSGKSYVAHRLSEMYDAELLIADELGHVVMKKGTKCHEKIVKSFGKDILGSDGEIDRKKMADIIFKDNEARKRLDDIVHPEVIEYVAQYIDERKGMDGIIIFETAIMYECKCDQLCDEVWYVYVPADIRIKRLSDNRGYSVEKSRAIIVNQKPDEFFTEKADRIIKNDGSFEELDKELREAFSIEQLSTI